MDYEIRIGDCRELMKKLGDGNIDAVVTDPPYELGFMGKSWDRTGIAYQVDVWREVLRVLKPGGHLVAAGGSRTHHRLACAIEDAGFELRDTICHVFGSGFPKSLDVGKAIDQAAGIERKSDYQPNYKNMTHGKGWGGGKTNKEDPPITDAAKKWEGWGTALKPAAEFWTVARKPLEGTVVANVLKHGTGGLNIDGCRIPGSDGDGHWSGDDGSDETSLPGYDGGFTRGGAKQPAGRWPPNFVMSHSEDCADECAPSCPIAEMDRQSLGIHGAGVARDGGKSNVPGKQNPTSFHIERAPSMMHRFGDSGGASRFFSCFRYVAKAGRRERDEGLGELPRRSAGEVTNRKDGTAGLKSPRAGAGRTNGGRNTHPTVKPIALMRWLIRLVTPPGGLVLDLFAGSGSTGCAAVAEGFRFVGMEKDLDSAEIARMRVRYWASLEHQMDLFGTTF